MLKVVLLSETHHILFYPEINSYWSWFARRMFTVTL